MTDLRPETIALHGGQTPDPTTNARAVPIYQTTSYVFDDTQHAADLFALAVPGNIYTRIMNPTWDVLRAAHGRARGRHRGGGDGVRPGRRRVLGAERHPRRRQHRLASSTLYGGTYNLFAHTLPQYGIEVRVGRPGRPGRRRAARRRQDAARLRRDDRQPEAERRRHPRVGRRRARGTGCRSSSTTRCRRRSSAASSTTAPTSPSTPRRSTSAATAPRSAASSSTPGSFDWTAQRRPLPGPDAARPVVPRRRLVGRARPGRLHRPRPHRPAAQHRRRDVAVQRVPVPAGPRDAAAADGAALGERARRRAAPRGPRRRRRGSTTPASTRARTHEVAGTHPHGRLRRPRHVRDRGRPSRRAGSSSRASSCSATSRTSATRSRSRSTTRRRRTRS